MEGTAGALAGDLHVDAVRARLLDVDRVDEPLAGPRPSQIELAAGRLAPLEVYARLPVRRFLLLLVLRLQVVVGHALGALVEILKLDRAGDDVKLPLVRTRRPGPGIPAAGGGAAEQR